MERQAATQLLNIYVQDLPFINQLSLSTLYQEYTGCTTSKDSSLILNYVVDQSPDAVKQAFPIFFEPRQMSMTDWQLQDPSGTGMHYWETIARNAPVSENDPLIIYRVGILERGGQGDQNNQGSGSGIYLGIYYIEGRASYRELENLDEAFANHCPEGVWRWMGSEESTPMGETQK